MAESPYYTVVVKDTNVDITEHVSGVKHEDCMDEDDLITIDIETADVDLVDSPSLNAGNKVIVSYGLMQSGSRKIEAVIKDFEPSFDSSISITLKLRDLGFLMKKDTANTVYTKKTASDIVKEIAAAYNLSTDIEYTTKVYDSIAQGNLSYFDFCKKLAKDEGSTGNNGSIEFYVRGSTLYFKKRNLSQESRRTFTYGNGTVVKSFKPKFEQENEGKSSSVLSNVVDKETGEVSEVKKENPGGKETGTGKKSVAFDAKGKMVKAAEQAAGAVVAMAGDKDKVEQKVDAMNKDAATSQITATLVTELITDIEAGDIITMAGVGKKLSGNYQVRKITNSVESEGESTMELAKSGTGKAITKDATDAKANTTQGNSAENKNKSVPVVQFDAKGKKK